MKTLAVGCGAGFSGDRTDAAPPVVRTLVERGGPAALIFENLAERTLAHQQLTRRASPHLGYEPLLLAQLRPVLADCLAHGITIVGNFGAANPPGAAAAIAGLARELGLPVPRIAVVTGDDLSDERGRGVVRQHLGAFDEARFVCANAYQGAAEIAQAIRAGAQVVVTGRVADPSLTVGPAMAHYGWREDDWDALAGATMAGHLLECGAQVTGGYFADPGRKEVPGLHDVGFPIAEIEADGSCTVTKAARTGGLVSEQTVKEQLLYEVHDPAAYITPDVVADITAATVTQAGPDRVRLAGVRGHPRTATLKALAYFDGGWFGEAEISYAGPNAEARARLAMDVVRRRNGARMPLRFDLIGVLSIHADDAGQMLGALPPGASTDLRLRVAGRHDDVAEIDWLLRDVMALWTGGPAGGGGVRTAKRQRLSNQACLVPRELAPASWRFHDAAA
ncbi:acyclic terpene utilization AtuA family protein [Ramlibacter sp. MAHUQ-53]|uniref:acyclic terpene utilization AtuA family protein n=1 Tax=unclassified Ramlibacter TaxID=2617605 RepID=UPI0036313DA7